MFCRQRLDIKIKCSEMKQKDTQWPRGSCVIFSCCKNWYHVIYSFFSCVHTDLKKTFLPVTAGGGGVRKGAEERKRIGCWMFRNISSLCKISIFHVTLNFMSSNAAVRILGTEALYWVLPIILTRLHNSHGQQTLSPSSWRQEYVSICTLNSANLRVVGEWLTESKDCRNVTVYLHISLLL
jgi:hypothetical protein